MEAEDRLKEFVENEEINSLDAAKQEGFIKGWNEALRIHNVVGKSEQFFCQHKLVLDCKEQCHKCKQQPNS
jgi:hypothetical protein